MFDRPLLRGDENVITRREMVLSRDLFQLSNPAGVRDVDDFGRELELLQLGFQLGDLRLDALPRFRSAGSCVLFVEEVKLKLERLGDVVVERVKLSVRFLFHRPCFRWCASCAAPHAKTISVKSASSFSLKHR